MTSKEISDFIELFMLRKRPSIALLFDAISPSEFFILATVDKHEKDNQGAHITVNKLASVLGVSVPAVSRSLKNLEKRSLLNRVTDTDCRRNTMVILEPAGVEMMEKSREVLYKFAEKVMNRFTKEELNTLVEYQRLAHATFEEEIKPFIKNSSQQGGEL